MIDDNDDNDDNDDDDDDDDGRVRVRLRLRVCLLLLFLRLLLLLVVVVVAHQGFQHEFRLVLEDHHDGDPSTLGKSGGRFRSAHWFQSDTTLRPSCNQPGLGNPLEMEV